jgi:hypothetical protein
MNFLFFFILDVLGINANMKLCVSLLTFAVILATTSADWYTGTGGKVSWNTDCDFPGNDIGRNVSLATECGQLCVNNSQCRYFAWSSGICYLKSRHTNKKHFSGAVCGFVRDRVFK